MIIPKSWWPLAVAVTLMCGLVEVTVQQSYRQSANDPQIQMAEDGAAALARGTSVNALVPSAPVAMESSLAPFVMVYNNSGELIASSATLNGKKPTVPSGVLVAAAKTGENRVTWQPSPSARSAIVAAHYASAQHVGYVVVGRSLREVEKRESQLEIRVILAWIVTLATTLFASIFFVNKTGDSIGNIL